MSFQIAKVKGIPIKLHFTLLIAFVVIAWAASTGFMPIYFPGLTDAEYWIMGASGAVILFVSVFLHELMHSIVATGYGMKVRQIILFIFGGVSDLAEETKDFRKEFRIAIAGPAVSFAIAGGLAGLWWLTTQINSTQLPSLQMVEGVLLYGAFINLLLGAFNLIPAFPLDGGRILRAGLIKWNRDYDSATRTAAKIGIGISYGFMGLGFFAMLFGSFIGGIWILLIGWFLNSGAQSYLRQHELSSILSGVRVRDLMNTRVISVKQDQTVDELIRNYFSRYMKGAFPVVNRDEVLLGMISLRGGLAVPEDKREQLTIGDVMIPANDLAVMTPDRPADEALSLMTRKGVGKVFVTNELGILLGLISKTDILSVASERQEYRQEVKTASKEDAANRYVQKDHDVA